MKKIASFFVAAFALAAAWSSPAAAQSGCPYIAQGAVLTPGQWNNCFASKQDFPGGGSGTIVNPYTWTGVQNFKNDVYFGSGRPQCDPRSYGAKGDGSTDDLPAFNSCNTALAAIGGGVLFVSPSTAKYCFNTGSLTLGQGVSIVGAGNGYGDSGNAAKTAPSSVSSCGHNTSVLVFAAASLGMAHLDVQGNTFGSTVPAVVWAATRGVIYDSNINGGAPALEAEAGSSDSVINVSRITHSYGTANVYANGGGYLGIRNVLNTHYQCLPAGGSIASIAAWTPNTVVANCTILSATGPDSNVYYIQVKASTGGGTTGGTQPVLLPYNQNITDGSATEELLAPAQPFYDLLINNGAGVTEYATDHSGAAIGIGILGSSAGGAGSWEVLGTFGQNINEAVYAAGTNNNFVMIGGDINNCVTAGCMGVNFTPSWAGDSTISDVLFFGNPIGVYVGGGTNYTISDNQIFASSTAGVEIASGVGAVSVENGFIGTSTTYTGATGAGVLFNGGTADYVTVKGVNFSGATAALDGTFPSGAHNDIESQSIVSLGLGILANGVGYHITATQPTSPVTGQNAVEFDIASAGSASQTNRAFRVLYSSGYTGPSQSVAVSGANQVAGTGNTPVPASEVNGAVGNVGTNGVSTGVTAGLNVGATGSAQAGITNVGLAGYAQVSENSGTNVGVLGTAFNAGTGTAPAIGGFFGINAAIGTESAALIADIGLTNVPIFRGRINGADFFVIDSSGDASAHGNILAGNALQVGSTTPASIFAGEMAFAKISPTGLAPSAGFLKIEAVAGTAGGSCKLIAYAGTSTTPVTIVDNVGSGC